MISCYMHTDWGIYDWDTNDLNNSNVCQLPKNYRVPGQAGPPFST